LKSSIRFDEKPRRGFECAACPAGYTRFVAGQASRQEARVLSLAHVRVSVESAKLALTGPFLELFSTKVPNFIVAFSADLPSFHRCAIVTPHPEDAAS
jgi:hypothetical protein